MRATRDDGESCGVGDEDDGEHGETDEDMKEAPLLASDSDSDSNSNSEGGHWQGGFRVDLLPDSDSAY